MTERILHLTLKRKYFDLIKSGKKKVEYREVKPYWIKRLTYMSVLTFCHPQRIDLVNKSKEFDFIIFSNGYKKDSPKIKVEWMGMDIDKFQGEKCFAIKLGKIKEI